MSDNPGAVVVCTSEAVAESFARRTSRKCWRHYGLFPGWSGHLDGCPVEVIVAEPGENSVYVAVRQMVPLFTPRAILYISECIAVAEDLRAGDVSLIRETRRCYCPVIVTDNMIPATARESGLVEEDELAFPDEETRSTVLNAPALFSGRTLTDNLVQVLNTTDFPESVQTGVGAICAGSTIVTNWAGRGAEYLRQRFRVDAVDPGSYGALLAASHVGTPAAGMLITAAGRGAEISKEYEYRRNRYLSAAAKMTEILVRHLLAGDLTATAPESSSADSVT